MITLKGEYNSALITVDTLDSVTLDQIRLFLNQPVFSGTNIVIMPDAHKGEGSCIGFTMPINDYIIPNIVGVDVGCGVIVVELGKINIDLVNLDKFIHNNIPHGYRSRSCFKDRNYPSRFFVAKNGESVIDKIKTVCDTISEDNGDALRKLGTLGGGNHFIEVAKDKDEMKYLLIHSGSRHFGKSVAEFYQKWAVHYVTSNNLQHVKTLEYLPVRSLGLDYLRDMKVAQEYASLNRKMMAHDIMSHLGITYQEINILETIHNYIGDDNIIRKGAISAKMDELVVIPFNMRDGSILAYGKGNIEWNNSAPHGAGRLLSRKKAKAELSLDVFKKQMKDIYTTTVSQNTLDEAPGAYKDKDEILKALEPTVSIVSYLKPIYSFKSDEEGKY